MNTFAWVEMWDLKEKRGQDCSEIWLRRFTVDMRENPTRSIWKGPD